jgi:hypothetical protein
MFRCDPISPSFKLHPTAPPDIRVVVHYGAQSEQVKRNEGQFFAKHPELNHPRNGLEEMRE